MTLFQKQSVQVDSETYGESDTPKNTLPVHLDISTKTQNQANNCLHPEQTSRSAIIRGKKKKWREEKRAKKRYF